MEEFEEIIDDSEAITISEEKVNYLTAHYGVTKGAAERYMRILEYLNARPGKLFWYGWVEINCGKAGDTPYSTATYHGLWPCEASVRIDWETVIPEFAEQSPDVSYYDLIKLFNRNIPFSPRISIWAEGRQGNIICSSEEYYGRT